MTYPRVTHYWLWFIVLGLVPMLALLDEHVNLSAENFWLVVVGGVGLITGSQSLSARWAKPFDLIVGIFFFAAGLVGVFHNFGLNLMNENANLPGGAISGETFLGVSLELHTALLHVVFGFLSLNFGIKGPGVVSSLMVNTTEKGK